MSSSAPQSSLRRIAVAVVLCSFLYLTWRLWFSVPKSDWWLGVPLWLLELHVTLRFAITVTELWGSDSQSPRPTELPPLSVAVVIPTYDEGIEVLLPTVAAALAMEPAHETWVLDDGHRPEMEEMARHLGAGYISRPTNEHAKAGNLNHALQYLDVDLMAVLDADHVPQPQFLAHTLPFFADERLALLQTPQEFFNTDSFVHGDAQFHEEQFFHRAIQAGKNRFGAAFWCGTGSVIRVAALLEVGGSSTVSITEDLHTSMLLHRAGWKTHYHDETLAQGLAARNYEEFTQQRWRWGAGAMQALAADNPLVARGLTPGQRFAYGASFSSWFDSWRTLGILLMPILVLFTGASPVGTHEWFVLPLALCVASSQMLTVKFLSGGRLRLLFFAVFDVLRMPANLSSTLVYLRPRSLGFSVTPKGRTGDERTICRVPILLRLISYGCVAAWAVGVGTLVGLPPFDGVPFAEKPDIATLGALCWVLANLLIVYLAMARINDQRYGLDQRGAVRIDVSVPADFAGVPAQVHDVSLSGARLVLADLPSLDLTSSQELVLDLGRPVSLHCTVRHRARTAEGFVEVGVQFSEGQWFGLADLATAVLRRGRPPERVGVELLA